jgi:hypothetical protein
VVVTTWLAALAGAGVIALGLADRESAPRAAAPAPAAGGPDAQVGQRIKTSFGTMSVDYVYRLTGADRPMGVAPRRGEIPVQIGVSVMNLGRKPLAVDPSMMQLRDGRGSLVVGRLRGNRLEPLSQHRFTLRYAVPARAQLPLLEIRDPAGGRPTTVGLGARKDLFELDVRTHLPTRPSTR